MMEPRWRGEMQESSQHVVSVVPDTAQIVHQMGHSHDWEGMHILLVDDENVSRRTVGQLLKSCNYEVTAVSNATEAITELESKPNDYYQLVLTDVVMPSGGDGIDLLEKIQNSVQWSHIPVVMMSANERSDTVRECIQRGAAYYLIKPVTKKELQNIWQHMFRRDNGDAAAPPSAQPVPNAHATQVEADEAEPSDPSTTELGSDVCLGPAGTSAQTIFASGAEPLNNALESLCLPWSSRLSIFCQLLHSTIQSFKQDVKSGPPAAPALAAVPFVTPHGIYITKAGKVFFGPSGHLTSQRFAPCYRAPARAITAKVEPYDCVYALGVLLLELALMPSSADERAAHLSALPALPTSLLSDRPALAVLVLRMIAADADERPSLDSLTSEATLTAAYKAMTASLSADAAADLLLQTAIAQVFLEAVEKRQTEVVHELTASMARLEDDLRQVQAALHLLQPGTDALPAVNASELPVMPELSPSQFGAQPGRHREAFNGYSESEPYLARARDSSARPRDSGTDDAAVLGGCDADAGDVPSTAAHRHTEPADSSAGLMSAVRSEDCDQLKRKRCSSPMRWPHEHALPGSPRKTSRRRTSCLFTDDASPSAAAANSYESYIHTLRRSSSGAKTLSVWGRLEPLFPHLYDSYSATTGDAITSATKANGAAASASSRPGYESSSDLLKPYGYGAEQSLRMPPRLHTLLDSMRAVSRYSRLAPAAVVQHHTAAEGSSGKRMVCSVALDRAEEMLGTASVNKAIRLYSMSDLLDTDKAAPESPYPVLEIASRSKLSCICFNAYIQARLAASDAEGGVNIWDTHTGHDIMAFEEHTDRVWSVDCSPLQPRLLLSASTDCTVRLWDTNQEASVAVVEEDSAVCDAVFSPVDSNLIAIGSSSCRARLYDVRKLNTPLATVSAPRAVSYVRFMDQHLIASVVDSAVLMFNIDGMVHGATDPVRQFRGHLNNRNFVGLACTQSGYILTGSETNEVVLYHQSLPAVIAKAEMAAQDGVGFGATTKGSEKPIVSCVAVTKSAEIVISGGTTGWINAMRLMK